ncbi:MAG: Nif3-like dinuclear metal center hexameric protein, partial [Bacteroidota bacterium]
MKISAVLQFLEQMAPPSYQESYDNSGLLVGSPNWEITGVMVCLDALET